MDCYSLRRMPFTCLHFMTAPWNHGVPSFQGQASGFLAHAGGSGGYKKHSGKPPQDAEHECHPESQEDSCLHLGSPVVPFSLFLVQGSLLQVTNPNKGTLMAIWSLGDQATRLLHCFTVHDVTPRVRAVLRTFDMDRPNRCVLHCPFTSCRCVQGSASTNGTLKPQPSLSSSARVAWVSWAGFLLSGSHGFPPLLLCPLKASVSRNSHPQKRIRGFLPSPW